MPTQVIVAGNGFQPTRAEVQGLSGAGHVPAGALLKAVPGRPWTDPQQARMFGAAVANAAKSQTGATGPADMRTVNHDGKEYLLIALTVPETAAAGPAPGAAAPAPQGPPPEFIQKRAAARKPALDPRIARLVRSQAVFNKVGPSTPVQKGQILKPEFVDSPAATEVLMEIKKDATLTSQGTKTGERVLIQFEEKAVYLKTLDELGMRPKMQEQLAELLNLESGMLFFSSIPGAGLRTTMDVVLRQMDRLMREFVAIEAEDKRYTEVENVPVTTYNPAEGQSPADLLPKLLRSEPNVVVCRDLPDARTVSLLIEAVGENRLVISTMRAKDCAEALLRVLAIGVSGEELGEAVRAVLCQRLIRKLCEKCKEAYMPPPQVLQQLGIPQGRIRAFYRPPQQPEEVCEQCGGVGYYGRTALFELLTVGDTVRKVLAGRPKLELMRSAARKDGMKSFQEEGILLVAKGTTSLPELMRVLKQ